MVWKKTGLRLFAFAAFLGVVAPSAAFAQSDEIQVYDGGLADKGKFNLTFHSNFAPKGQKSPAFPGSITPDHSLNGAAEWAYGVTDFFEAGLYLPLYSVDKDLGAKINGWKLRALFAVPKADERKFFYGVNFEFSINSKHWDEKHFTSEVRPIVGLHLKPIDVIFNPILDTTYQGGFGSLEFAPSTRVAYNVKKDWALSIEHYADYGPLRDFVPGSAQSHQIFGVVDHSIGKFEIQGGVGVGVTGASDKIALKVIISRDLN